VPQVTTVLTVATPAQLLGAFLRAIPGATQQAAAIVTAQACVETANGTAMHNWNPGNVTVASTSSASWMLQGSNTLHFAAYPNLAAGAAAMVSWLTKNGALPHALSNDLAGYMGALQAGCYLGCVGSGSPPTTQQDYTNYQNGISSRLANLDALAPDFSLVSGLTIADWLLIGGTAAVAGWSLWDAFPGLRRIVLRSARHWL
jgi:hypothetical protein